MKLVQWLEFSGVEIANITRTRDYIRNGLLPIPTTLADCNCTEIDQGPYINPDYDNAPWLDSLRLESEQFLGFLASDIRLDPVISRAVTPRFLGGATVGKMRPRHRIVAVSGILLSSSEQGMAYGERWLTDVLAGVIVGCAPDTLRVLLACPETNFSPQYRTLRRVGIVDGPNFAPVASLAECHLQEVTFQVAAGLPYLLGDAQACLSVTSLVGGS